jgi:hypothetical protein
MGAARLGPSAIPRRFMLLTFNGNRKDIIVSICYRAVPGMSKKRPGSCRNNVSSIAKKSEFGCRTRRGRALRLRAAIRHENNSLECDKNITVLLVELISGLHLLHAMRA